MIGVYVKPGERAVRAQRSIISGVKSVARVAVEHIQRDIIYQAVSHFRIALSNSSRLTAEGYKKAILGGDRVILARAITLMESALTEDQSLANEVLDSVISYSGNSIRLGITGAPGVGKSTFIELFGKSLTTRGRKIAVLTVDPTSQITRGSILGDKTRMADLAILLSMFNL